MAHPAKIEANWGVASKQPPSPPLGDVAIVCGKDAQGLHILRRRSEDAPIEAAVIQPLAEGRPITGEVISMRPRKDFPFLFDAKTEIEAPAAAPARATSGPAQVASNSYRSGWDAIWGPRQRRERLN
jgi:hypothetical protein